MATAPFLLSHSVRPISATSDRQAFLKTWLPVLMFASIFAIESTAPFGADHTSGPLHSVARGIVGSSVDHNWSYTHHILRKIGHFCGYGMFSLVCFRGVWMSLRGRVGRLRTTLAMQGMSHGLALAATLLVASADEIHQTFLPNRTGNFGDVMLDMSGALSLQIVLFLSLRIAALWQSRRSWQTFRADAIQPSSFALARRFAARRRRIGWMLTGRAASGSSQRLVRRRQSHRTLDLLHG